MLVALSGAQGSGKTTVLNKLKDLGFNVVERKTARSILTEWNTTLDEVYRDPTTAIKFQNEILSRKIADEADAIASDQLWFTERSYADLFTYAVLTVGRYNEHDQWVNEYFSTCCELNKRYLNIIYLEGGAFATQNDGVRGFNTHYVSLVNDTVISTLNKMITVDQTTFERVGGYTVVPRYVSTVEDRTRTVAHESQQLWLAARLPHPTVTLFRTTTEK